MFVLLCLDLVFFKNNTVVSSQGGAKVESDINKVILAENHDAYRREHELFPQGLGENTKIGVFYYTYKNSDGHDEPGIDAITLKMLAPEAQADLIRGYRMRQDAFGVD